MSTTNKMFESVPRDPQAFSQDNLGASGGTHLWDNADVVTRGVYSLQVFGPNNKDLGFIKLSDWGYLIWGNYPQEEAVKFVIKSMNNDGSNPLYFMGGVGKIPNVDQIKLIGGIGIASDDAAGLYKVDLVQPYNLYFENDYLYICRSTTKSNWLGIRNDSSPGDYLYWCNDHDPDSGEISTAVTIKRHLFAS